MAIEPSERREFLRVCVTGGAALLGAGVGAWAVAAPMQVAAAADQRLPLIPMLRLAGLEKGPPLVLSVTLARRDGWRLRSRSQQVFLLRTGNGGEAQDFTALSPVCPHKGCSVQAHEDAFVCPCHDARFELSGERIEGPAPRGLDPLELSIGEHAGAQWMFVRWQDFVIGTTERIARPA